MKESIKKRIEAVRRGEVPEGYSTEHAMLFPDEWGTPVALNTVLSENKDRNEGLRFDKEDVLSVSGEQGIVNQIDLLGRSYAGESVAPYHVVETGDVVYTKSPLKENPYGIIKQNRGVPGIVSTLYAVYHCSTPITGQYLENYFCIDTYLNNYLKPLVKRGAKNDMKVNNEEVLLGRIPLPSLREQERINEIIAQFNRMIERKQSKIDELKKLKQVCLLEMFPQEGQTIPKRRFPGFSAPWEQRKLGELIREISTGKSVNSDEGIVGVDNIGVLKTSCVSYDHFDPSESKPVVKDERHLVKCSVEEDSVIVSRMNTPERVGACGYVERSIPNLFLPDRLWKLKFQENVNTYFLYTMLISGGYKEKITSMASGTSGSMYNIPKDAFLNLRLTLSLDIDEQKKIGDYFKQLDRLITLHQRELAEVGKYKEALMQLLLTGLVRVNA